MDEPPRVATPTRTVLQMDALAFLEAHPAPEGACVFTSMPDVSEVPLDLSAWRIWFVDAARRILRWLPEGGTAIFFQSDVRVSGALVDKGYLVLRAVEEESASLLFHKIVCRHPPGTIAFGRPSYSHLIGATRGPAYGQRAPGPDVLADGGWMPWSRAVPVEACRLACRHLAGNARARVLVDPFCGRGTALAAANEAGMDAIGVDLSARRCRAARSFRLDPPRTEDAGEKL